MGIDEITFGGFTFANNSGEKQDVDVAPSTDPNAIAYPVLPPAAGPSIPNDESGNASYDVGFQGAPRPSMLFYVAPPVISSSGEGWWCYRLGLPAQAYGVNLTASQPADQLANPGACTVQYQTEDHAWHDVPEPELDLHFVERVVPTTD